MTQQSRDFKKSINVKGYDKSVFRTAIYTLRKIKGMNQIDFSQYMGISQSSYGRFELGDFKRLPVDFVERVAKELNKEVHEILPPVNTQEADNEILEWAGTLESMPYLRKAYQEYLYDKSKK